MGLLQLLKGTMGDYQKKLYLNNRNESIGKYTVDGWDGREIHLGTLGSLQGNLSEYNHTVGIYKAYYQGKLVYIGRAVEYSNGGFRKRLTDYIREGDSGRGTSSSSKMNKYKDDIQIGIIPVGTDESAAEITKRLELLLIGKYQPEWNVQHNR